MRLKFLFAGPVDLLRQRNITNFIELDVQPTDTFRDIVHQITRRIPFGGCTIRMIFQGRPLEWDAAPAGTVNLANNSCIHIVVVQDAAGGDEVSSREYRLWNDRPNNSHSGPSCSGAHTNDIVNVAVLYGVGIMIAAYLWHWKLNFPYHFSSLSSFLLTVFSGLLGFSVIRRIAAFFLRNKRGPSTCSQRSPCCAPPTRSSPSNSPTSH